jgi:methylmalonyl-CoA/ethylmalonyl-CoA epimerase
MTGNTDKEATPALHHLGIAVRDLEEAVTAWGALGLQPSHQEAVPGDRVRVAFLPFRGGRLELLEPLDEASPVARFLERRGPGLHHVAFEVEHLDIVLADLRAQGVRLIDETARPGAHGSRVAFLHPAATGGVLVELVEPGQKGGEGP